MFEARLGSTTLLKKIVDALKEIINQSTLDCSDGGIQVCILKSTGFPIINFHIIVAVDGQFARFTGGYVSAA